MAEAVGLAASVAGLVGLAGQVLQGGLFIQKFFDDVRNAPAEVQDLKDELDLFTFIANDTKKLFETARDDGVPVSSAAFEWALERCGNIVDDIGSKLEHFVGEKGKEVALTTQNHPDSSCGPNVLAPLEPSRNSERPRIWWAKLKVASRKKALGEYLQRLERAKSQLLAVQANLTQILLLSQSRIIQDTRASLEGYATNLTTTATILGDIQSQSRLLVRRIEDVDSRFDWGLAETGENTQDLQMAFHAHSPGFDADDPHMASNSPSVPGRHSEYIDESPTTSFTSNTGHVFQTIQTERLPRKRGRIIRRQINLCIMQIEIEYSTQDTSSDTDHTLIDGPGQHRSVRGYTRLPFLRRNFGFHYQQLHSSYTNAFDMQLRTYNILPRDAPIFRACRRLDLNRVKTLFETKAASPADRFIYPRRPMDEISPIEIVFGKFCLCLGAAEPEDRILNIVELIHFLLPFYYKEPWIISSSYFCSYIIKILFKNVENKNYVSDVVREILCRSMSNPFEGIYGFISFFLDFESQDLPLPKFLVEQKYHEVDALHNWDNCLFENDRQIIADPDGKNLEDAILRKDQYLVNIIFSPSDFLIIDGEIGLLELVSTSKLQGIRSGCANRLAFLLKAGCIFIDKPYAALRADYYVLYYDALSNPPENYCLSRPAFSLLERAFDLNLHTFLAGCMLQVGWTHYKIMDLFDEELYRGFLPLMDGEIEYKTQAACRADFVNDLMFGRLSALPDQDLKFIPWELSFNIGVGIDDTRNLIRDAIIAYRQKLLPGSWNEEEDIRVFPGVDFSPYTWKLENDESDDWNGWRKRGDFLGKKQENRPPPDLDIRDWLTYEDEVSENEQSEDE